MAGKQGERHRGFTKITRAIRVGHFADDKRMTDNDPHYYSRFEKVYQELDQWAPTLPLSTAPTRFHTVLFRSAVYLILGPAIG